jgi:serine/threonine protein kinase
MPWTPVPSDTQISRLRQIDLIADDFEQQWQENKEPNISSFLGGVARDRRLQLLQELILVDLEYRKRKRLPIALTSYFDNFPELAQLSPSAQETFESHAKKVVGDPDKTMDYLPHSESLTEHPQSIGRYLIGGCLGSGGQADVYLSFHPELIVPVVIKWQKQTTASATDPAQMAQEGRTLANLAPHPNLVRVYDLGTHEDRPYLVLEYLPGVTLEQHARDKLLTPEEAARLLARLARGVHSANEQGAIHQDINPRNVVIDRLGEPRLIDFGLSWFRPSWSDQDARPDGGTLQYLSPEQADPQFAGITRRTDVFGLGAVFYFLLSGRPLYEGSDRRTLFSKARSVQYNLDVLEKKKIPSRLIAICKKALAVEPRDRYDSAAEFADALKRVLEKRSRLRTLSLLTALFLITVASGWLIGHFSRKPDVSADKNDKGEPVATAGEARMNVTVWRSGSYPALVEALPLRNHDRLRVSFAVPPAMHISLAYVNGQGKLSLIRQYPPQEVATTLHYPGQGEMFDLEPPTGTEGLLLCGRPDSPVTEQEIRAAWDDAAAWPLLNPPQRLLRLHDGKLRDEGEIAHDIGKIHEHPDLDAVPRRLENLRNRLGLNCPLFEGLAFRHD